MKNNPLKMGKHTNNKSILTTIGAVKPMSNITTIQYNL